MRRTESPPHRARFGSRLGLFGASAWSHRWGAVSWAAGVATFLIYFGFGYQVSVRTFKGGAAGFGAAAAAVAETMRPLSGAAERLDTYGGYVTYHNASIAALLLSVWAVIQGARAVRGWEERGAIELWMATGRRRWQVVVDQWLGFLASLLVIAAGIGLGFGLGALAAQEPDWAGSAIVAMEMALVAATFFGLGMMASQLTRSARAGAGIVAVVMGGLYVGGNMAPDLGSFQWLRFASPFFYFQQSNALVPGHSLDIAATAVLMGSATIPVVLAAVAFQRRDLGSALVQRREKVTHPLARVRLRGPWLRDTWLADLRAQWISIALWAISTAVMMALVVSVANTVATVWENSEAIKRMFMRLPGFSFIDQYMTYVTILAAIAPVAFVVVEASRWLDDISERRTEAVLAISGSRTRVLLEWAMSTTAGVLIIALSVLAGCLAGAVIGGFGLHFDGLVRTAADTTLLGCAVCGVALLAVAVFRSGAAVGGLGAVLGAGFFISLFGPMFNWPEWVVRLSPFEAFGTPYASVPRLSGLALMAGLAVIGAFAAAVVAQRRPSLA